MRQPPQLYNFLEDQIYQEAGLQIEYFLRFVPPQISYHPRVEQFLQYTMGSSSSNKNPTLLIISLKSIYQVI